MVMLMAVCHLSAFILAGQTCTSLAIPENGCGSGTNLLVPITISSAPGSNLGTDVFLDKVDLIIDHHMASNLDIYLRSPSGIEIELSTDNGFTYDYGDPTTCPNNPTSFADWATTSITSGSSPFIGAYLPEMSFSNFNGGNPNGVWTLRICDDTPVSAGNFIYANLSFTTCLRPVALVSSAPTANGATLNWTANGPATAWDIEFQPAGTAQTGTPTVSGVTSKPYAWTGGAPGTIYQAWIRSNCGGSVSAWIGPTTFTTKIDNSVQTCTSLSIPDNGCNAGNYLQVPVVGSGAPGRSLGTDVFIDRVELIVQHTADMQLGIFLQSPGGTVIDLSSDNGLFGDHYGNPSNCPNQVTAFAPWASVSITAGVAPFIGTYLPEGSFSAFNGVNPNGEWLLKICDGSSFITGNLIYVKIFFTTCPRPTGLVAGTPTVNGATVNWTENGNATAWDIEFQPAGTAATGIPTVTGTGTKPYVWTGGTQYASYQAWVRSSCGGSASGWSGPVTFTTLLNNAAPVCTATAIPDAGCISIPVAVSGAPGSTLGTDVYLDKADLIVQHTRDSDLDIYLQSPNGTEIDLTSDNGGTGDHYGNPASCPGQVTTFAGWAGGSVTAGTAPFIGNYTPEVAFSAFNGSNANGNWTLRVCDDASPNTGNFVYARLSFTSCPRPSGFAASSITPDGATFNWTETGTATTWEMEFQPAGTAATGTPTVSGITSKPYIWTGAQQATGYQAWVRSNCGGSVSEWIGPVSILTPVDNAAPACITFNMPDGGCIGSATNSIQVPVLVSGAPGTTLGSGVYLNRVDLIIQHTFDSQVTIGLRAPSGVEINLCDGNGGSGDNFGNPAACTSQVTTFDTWAAGSITAGSAPFIGSYRPETPFSTFDGANPNGTWTLNVCDELSGNTGSVRYVKLFFSTALPVALTTFTATPVEGKSVRLQWATAAEHNSARFDVERSADGQQFHTIATVPAAGNTNDEHKYERMDRTPLPAENYYRLRQVDADGTFEYAPIRVVTLPDRAASRRVYPNPAQVSFFVENDGEEGRLSLFDVAGNPVLEQALPAGSRRTEIRTEGLPSGFYSIKIQTESGVFGLKVVVERE